MSLIGTRTMQRPPHTHTHRHLMHQANTKNFLNLYATNNIAQNNKMKTMGRYRSTWLSISNNRTRSQKKCFQDGMKAGGSKRYGQAESPINMLTLWICNKSSTQGVESICNIQIFEKCTQNVSCYVRSQRTNATGSMETTFSEHDETEIRIEWKCNWNPVVFHMKFIDQKACIRGEKKKRAKTEWNDHSA